jgi:hypothetical protein
MTNEKKADICRRCKRAIKGTAYMKRDATDWRPYHYSCSLRVKG